MKTCCMKTCCQIYLRRCWNKILMWINSLIFVIVLIGLLLILSLEIFRAACNNSDFCSLALDFFTPNKIAVYLGVFLTYLGFVFQWQHRKHQVWERIREQTREGLTFQLLHEWYQLGLAGLDEYALLSPGDWLVWFSRNLIYPFAQIVQVQDNQYRPEFRTFLDLAVVLDAREMRPLWQALRLLQSPNQQEKALVKALRWWRTQDYHPLVWPVLVWMFWWIWETRVWAERGQNNTNRDTSLSPKRKESGRNLNSKDQAISGTEPQMFCDFLKGILRRLDDEDRFLASLLTDEVLRRAGIDCPRLSAAAYRPEGTLWHEQWAQWQKEIDEYVQDVWDVARPPQSWPWAVEERDPETHLIFVGDHILDLRWALDALYGYWKDQGLDHIFPVVIRDLSPASIWEDLAEHWLYWIAPERNPWAFWSLAGHNQRRLLSLFRRAFGSTEVGRARLWALWDANRATPREFDYERSLFERWNWVRAQPSTLLQEVKTFLVMPPRLRNDRPWRIWFVYLSEASTGHPTLGEVDSRLTEFWPLLRQHHAYLRAILPREAGEKLVRKVGGEIVELVWTRQELEETWARWLRRNRGLSPEATTPWRVLLPEAQAQQYVNQALTQAQGSLGRFLDRAREVMLAIVRERTAGKRGA